MTTDTPHQTSRAQVTGNPALPLPAAPPRLITLILLTALAVLPVNMILPSLPNIAATFHADFALVNLSVAGYAIATALTEIIAGAISDRYGRRPVVLMAVTIFIVASIGCALASNIGIFLLFRAMQAAIAACFSVALVVIKETSGERKSGERKAASKFGYLAMGWAIAPMLGPLFGGSLDQVFGWRSSFVVLAIIGVAILALSLRTLRETSTHARRSNGAYLAAYGELLHSARFWAYTMCMACSMGTLYVFLGGAPLAMDKALGGSSAKLGLYMGMVPAGFILGSYLAGRYATRHGLNTTLVFGRLLTCIGLLVGLILAMPGIAQMGIAQMGIAQMGVMQVLAFFGPCMFIGIGNGLSMPAANTGALSVRADLAGTAAGLAAALTIAGGALIASLAGLFLGGSGAIEALLGMMLIAASLALLAALCAAVIERRRSKLGSD